MGNQAPKRYDEDFKREAVRLAEESGIERVAIDLGVGKTSLARWRLKYGHQPPRPATAGETPEQELARLRRRARELEEEPLKAPTFR